MAYIAPVFTKLAVTQGVVGIRCAEFFQGRIKNIENMSQKKFTQSSQARLSLTDFHATRNRSTELRIDLLYQISPKSVEKCGK
jgi:hypothetical protein